jgi:coenzyme PQQ precursor peptide PqqA
MAIGRIVSFILFGAVSMPLSEIAITHIEPCHIYKIPESALHHPVWTVAHQGYHEEEYTMAWTTPVLVEICIGLEINGYLPAEF